MQPNVTKQVKPALQQTALPFLQQQMEPKELSTQKAPTKQIASTAL